MRAEEAARAAQQAAEAKARVRGDGPDSGPHPTPARIVPEFIQCFQHGGWWRVERQAILTHDDGSKHVYAVATCGIPGGRRHEMAEYVRRAGP